MKNWLKSRKASPEVNQSDISLPLQTERINSEACYPHAWNRMSVIETSSIASDSNLPPSHKPPSVYTESNNNKTKPKETQSKGKFNNELSSTSITPELDLLAEYSSSVQPCKSMIQRKVIITSEHYFRLALESYEQLRAVHYRASLQFSLAEWLHIHALLLYGRIQQVQSTVENIGSVAQHNKIDLSGEISIFAPISTALNAIGTVEDTENGVLYIPDAAFPQRPSSDSAYSAAEMQQILKGVLYDWQRSWGRVLEARYERDSRDTKFTITRSSSELMIAIRDTANSIDRIRQRQQTIEEGEEEADDFVIALATKERTLSQLFEEARNAKDYTIRPPCNLVYNSTESVKTLDTSVSVVSSNGEFESPQHHNIDPRFNKRYPVAPCTTPKANTHLQPFLLRKQKTGLDEVYGPQIPHVESPNLSAHDFNPQILTSSKPRKYGPVQPRSERFDSRYIIPQKLEFKPQKQQYQKQLQQQLHQEQLEQQQQLQLQHKPLYKQPQQRSPEMVQIQRRLSPQAQPQQHEVSTPKKSPKIQNLAIVSPSLEEKSRFDTYALNTSEVSLLTPPDTSVDSDIISFVEDTDSTAVDITSQMDKYKQVDGKLNGPFLSFSDEDYCGEITDDDIEERKPESKQDLSDDDIKSFMTADESNQNIHGLGCQRSPLFTSIPPFEPLGSPTSSQKSQLLSQSPMIPQSPMFSQSPLLSNRNFSNSNKQQIALGATDLPLNTKKSNLKVKIGGSSDSLDQFVHYDAQLWANYTTFVNSLRNAGLADFRPMSNTYTGNFAWALPVKVNIKSPSREVVMKLPHKLVSKQDQALALILQTCYDSQEPMQSWHNQVNVDIDVRTLLTKYIATAVDDRTRD